MKIVKGEIVKEVEYKYEFTDGHGNGYSFDCDKDGNVVINNKDAKANYEWCLEHESEFESVGLRKRTWSYRENDTGVCDVCGKKILMYDEYMGACECEHCGQWYNLFGQPLLPPDQWEEDCVW